MPTNSQIQLDTWSERIRQWEASGISASRWCQANQIKPGRFYYWRNRIGEQAEPVLQLVRISFAPLPDTPYRIVSSYRNRITLAIPEEPLLSQIACIFEQGNQPC